MNIVEPSFEVVTLVPWVDMMKHIEKCARLCYKSEGNITDDSWMKLIRATIDRGHESVIEHIGFTVVFTVDRGVSHEIVRHRLASYSQESTRYCNYSNDKFGNEITVIDIEGGMALDTRMKDLPQETICAVLTEWGRAMAHAQNHYNNMIALGATPQIARSVLPNSTKTEIAVTMNMREWRHFLKMRTDKPAHPQMREVTQPLLRYLIEVCPVIFGDLRRYLDEQ